MSRHVMADDSRLREVRVPVATLWTSPQAPRADLDAAAVADEPDMAAWVATLDAEGTDEHRLGLHGRTLTQLLLGEPVVVLEEQGDWARVAALWQSSSGDPRGYPGWMRRSHLDSPVVRETGVCAGVTSRSATATRDDGSPLPLSCGTVLWADGPDGLDGLDGLDEVAVTVLLPGGVTATIPRADVHLGETHHQPTSGPDGLLATARQFLGIRYLWGGTSGWGLDCSGLVHLTLRAHQVLLPRDAFDQQAAPRARAIPLDDVRPADLYFFARPGDRVYHVGFATRPVEADGTRWMLHAPEGGTAAIEDAPLAPHRAATLVSAARIVRSDEGRPAAHGG